MSFAPRPRAWLIALLLTAGVQSAAFAQPMSGNGIVINQTPMYLAPDPARVPLTSLPPGTTVRVVAREGDWLRVVFRDRYLGDRTGYVLAANIRIEAPAAPPSPSGPPPPPVPGLVAPSTAPVPPPPAEIRVEREHGYFWLSGTYQDKSTDFATTTTFTSDSGPAAILTTYDGVQPIVADVAIGQHLWHGLGLQIAVTWAGQITDAVVSGGPRNVSVRAAEINRQELGLHLDVSLAVPTSVSRAQAVVFAGPSLFRVKQGLVTGLTAADAPTVVESTKQHIGVNGGVEVSVRVYKALGIGALVRYSRADVPFSPAPGVDVTIRAGGLQAGAGLHFRF